MSSASLLPAVTNASSPRASAAKKRKIRKGTFSCWECKKRKTRCELEPGSNATCAFCQRRGLACVSQEYANPADGIGSHEKAKLCNDQRDDDQSRVFRISNLFHHEDCDEEFGIQENITGSPTRRPQSSLLNAGEEPLSNRLLSLFPEPSIATLIMSRGRFSTLPIHLRHDSMQKLSNSILGVQHIAQVSELPSLTDPPVHFARKLIQLALCLQQLEETQSKHLEAQLKEPVAKVAKRYIEIASQNVTSQHALVESLEGVETILLES
jgi:hypothetical protein